MPHSEGAPTTYTLEDARADALYDLEILRKDMRRNMHASVRAHLAEALIKLRGQLLTLEDAIARQGLKEARTKPDDTPSEPEPVEPDPQFVEAGQEPEGEPVVASSEPDADGGAP